MTDIGFRYGDPIPGGTAATKVSTACRSANFSASYPAGAGTYTWSTNGRKDMDGLPGTPLRPRTIVIRISIYPALPHPPLHPLLGGG